MTLRYDRIDNFWFVLLHELAHLWLHFQKTEFQQFFDDLDAGANELETEADNFASEALVPNDIWETAVARYLRTSDSIIQLAAELGSGAVQPGRPGPAEAGQPRLSPARHAAAWHPDARRRSGRFVAAQRVG